MSRTMPRAFENERRSFLAQPIIVSIAIELDHTSLRESSKL
jgi:hypothetical protein